MALRTSLRRLPLTRPSLPIRPSPSLRLAQHRALHASRPAFVRVGDPVPDLEVLCESSPGNKVNLAEEFADGTPGIIVGVPAAFSGACSTSHVPSYMNHPKLAGAGKVFVVSVNDAFVMKAWAEQLDPAGQTGIRFLGDPSAQFTKALELDFDGSAIFGGVRGKRYALVIENGEVAAAYVEPDNTGTDVSMAKNVLG